jgi:hypothetical protein
MISVVVPPTSAHADITVAKNTTFSDAVQFDDADDTTWDFLNKTFRMGLKGNYEQDDETVAFTSAAAEIVVLDPALRILGFNVPHATLAAVLVPGCYVYDLLMTDTDTAVVTQLMYGEFHYAEAVTTG